MNEAAIGLQRFTDTLGALPSDYVINQLTIGSPEREAMTKFRDEANKAIVALKSLRKAARDAAYAMDVCGNG